MTIRARAMRAADIPVIALTIGEPDFASPAHAIEAAYEAAKAGQTKYPPQDGVPVLKQAIQRKFKRDQNLDIPLDEIMVANGGKGIIFDALMATINPGDEVIVPAPYWGAYTLMTQFVGGTPVVVTCPQNNGFRLRPEEAAISACRSSSTTWGISRPTRPSPVSKLFSHSSATAPRSSSPAPTASRPSPGNPPSPSPRPARRRARSLRLGLRLAPRRALGPDDECRRPPSAAWSTGSRIKPPAIAFSFTMRTASTASGSQTLEGPHATSKYPHLSRTAGGQKCRHTIQS